jgi:hypothetical protein
VVEGAALLKASLRARVWAERRRFEDATRHPELAQARVLDRLLRRNAATRFGHDHGFGTIARPAEYTCRVPIRDYEGFRPYVARIVAGEADALTAEAPVMFTTTSGTTGEPKLIPVTPSWRDEMAALMRLWTFYALRDHPGLLDDRILTMVSPAIEGTTATGIPFGAMSGLAYQRLPWLVRRKHVLPYAVTLIADHDTRYFVTMRLALARDVSSVGTPNPSTLIRLAETASSRAEEIVRAIHDGVLGVPDFAIHGHGAASPATVRRELGAGLRPERARAAFLEKTLGSSGTGSCWPGLTLVACWLGGNAGVLARRLGPYYGTHVPLRDLGLIASEGRLTLPLEDRSAAGVLAVHTTFFEFIPEGRSDDPTPPTLLAHELEDGERYYIILSGGNGLYRYDLNDIVEVRGFHERTPKVAFVRKGRDMVSITGEKLHLNQIQEAIRDAEQKTGVEIWQFRLIPDVEQSRYDLLVELAHPAEPAAGLAGFGRAVDQALGALNIEYAAKRASRRLGPPRLHVMRRGWAERLCRAEFHQGRRDHQHKWAAIRPEWDAASRAELLQSL